MLNSAPFLEELDCTTLLLKILSERKFQKKEWENERDLDQKSIFIFTDGSKLVGRAGCGAHFEPLAIDMVKRLSDH